MGKIVTIIIAMALFSGCTGKDNAIVTIETSKGTMRVRLYDDTPKHAENFKHLVREGFYDGLLFHRVIEGFMIQGGDPDSRDAAPGTLLGEGGPGYEIESEFRPAHFHRRGALAAAREGDDTNPERASAGSQFYIVQGKVYSPAELDQLVERVNANRRVAMTESVKRSYAGKWDALEKAGDKASMAALSGEIAATCDSLWQTETLQLTNEQREAYTSTGGTPHLDGQYTVFGEVVEGLDVLDRIAAVETDTNDRPRRDVVIKRMKIGR